MTQECMVKKEIIYFDKFSYYVIPGICVVGFIILIILLMQIIGNVFSLNISNIEEIISYVALAGTSIGLYVMLVLLLMCGHFPFMMYALCEKNNFKSFFLNKKMCEVDGMKPVYYTIADVSCGRGNCKCILLSNEKFGFRDKVKTSAYRIPSIKELKKMVIIPYENINSQYLDFENWISVTYDKAEITEERFVVKDTAFFKILILGVCIQAVPFSYIVDCLEYGIIFAVICMISLILYYYRIIKVDIRKEYFEYRNIFYRTQKVYYDNISKYTVYNNKLTIYSDNKKIVVDLYMINSDVLVSVLESKGIKRNA